MDSSIGLREHMKVVISGDEIQVDEVLRCALAYFSPQEYHVVESLAQNFNPSLRGYRKIPEPCSTNGAQRMLSLARIPPPWVFPAWNIMNKTTEWSLSRNEKARTECVCSSTRSRSIPGWESGVKNKDLSDRIRWPRVPRIERIISIRDTGVSSLLVPRRPRPRF